MTTGRRTTGFMRFLLLSILLLLAAVAVQVFYAAWPWSQGQPRGATVLQATLDAETRFVVELAGETPRLVIEQIRQRVSDFGAEGTGLAYWKNLAEAPDVKEKSPLQAKQRFVRSLAPLLGGAYWSVQLIGLRLGVLVVSAPLFLLGALGAAADGLAERYLRKTAGGRESSFIYHRAKLLLWAAIFLPLAIYLIPPVPMDPIWILPPAVLLFATGVRFGTAWFKKHL